jgi:DNA polymerase-3 subunit alpha
MLNNYTQDEEEGVKQYTEIQDGQSVTMGGMIGAYKKLKTRSGSFMAFVTVEDMLGSVECVCFPKIYDKIKSFLAPDVVVSVSGKISVTDDKAPSIIVDKMVEFTLEEPPEETPVQHATSHTTSKIAVKPVAQEKDDRDKTLWLNISSLDDEDVDELMETLCFYAGETKVIFVRDGKKLLCSQKVTPSRALFAELSGFLSEKCIKLL